MAHEAGIDFDLFDVAACMKDTPYFVDLRPGGKYVAKDLHEVGGVAVVMKELAKEGLLHLDCMTASGKTLGESLDEIRGEADGRVIYHIGSPITKTGGVVSLKGNVAPDGAIVKVAGMTEAEQVFTGPARVFECEEDAFAAVKRANTRKARSSSSATKAPPVGRGCARCCRPPALSAVRAWARRWR
jgi:dihydroxy-acid dehydratase